MAASAIALLAACSPDKPAPVAEAPKAAIGSFGIDLAAMDTSVKPGDDFYKYVNGKWLASFPIPADKTRYGQFDVLRDQSESDVRSIIEELSKTAPTAGSVQEKVVNFYNSWMDEAAIEAAGITPIQADLDAINAAKTKADIIKLMAMSKTEPPTTLTWAHTLLPPYHLISPMKGLPAGDDLFHVIGYGVALVAVALVLLVVKPLGSGGRA